MYSLKPEHYFQSVQKRGEYSFITHKGRTLPDAGTGDTHKSFLQRPVCARGKAPPLRNAGPSCVDRPFGRQGPADTLRQHGPQMTQRRCIESRSDRLKRHSLSFNFNTHLH